MTMRETVARALCEAVAMWLQTPSDRRERTDVEADAAIAALWPLAMEAAANVADEYVGDPDESRFDTADKIAASIRNLEPPQ